MIDFEAFAVNWCQAWNARDVERVLEHFHEDAIFVSPVAARLLPATGGRLAGKAAIRGYWNAAMAQIPDLRFTIERLFVGGGVLVIQYRNQKGVQVAEILEFDGTKVRFGRGCYALGEVNPAGLSHDPPIAARRPG